MIIQDEIKDSYFSTLNMKFGEYRIWVNSDLSFNDPDSRDVVQTNLRLLRIKYWNYDDYQKALEIIKYIENSNKENEIALKNYGLDITK